MEGGSTNLDFDPTDRDPNAKGGLTRTSYAMGKGPVLPSDEDPINPFNFEWDLINILNKR